MTDSWNKDSVRRCSDTLCRRIARLNKTHPIPNTTQILLPQSSYLWHIKIRLLDSSAEEEFKKGSTNFSSGSSAVTVQWSDIPLRIKFFTVAVHNCEANSTLKKTSYISHVVLRGLQLIPEGFQKQVIVPPWSHNVYMLATKIPPNLQTRFSILSLFAVCWHLTWVPTRSWVGRTGLQV